MVVLAGAIGFGLLVANSLKSCTVQADIAHADQQMEESAQ